MHRKHVIVIAVFIAAIYGCNKGVVDMVFEGFSKPSNFPEPVYHFNTNPVTKEGFELGRKLFYDPILSADNTISCGTCHVQTSAFTHHGHSVSHGIFDSMGTRNSPPIMNLAWNKSFMWDGGIVDMDLQSISPITNHIEMGETMENVLRKLQNSPVYPALFAKAYGSEEITGNNFLKSLSQFMAMCISSNSKYDSVMRGQGPVFTPEEQEGYKLVKQKCTPCHQEPMFTDYSFRNNGLSISSINDMGRYAITQNNGDKYKFKVPSLRNLAYTAPYMHDGRFFYLDAVLEHYGNRVLKTPNLDPQLQNGIPLLPLERLQILAFLATLNDKTFVLDKRLSEQ